jgi:geranylgeranyl diphosphate synthase type I
MKIQKVLKKLKARIERRLSVFLKEKVKEAGRVSPLLQEMTYHGMEFVMRGGKRIRPALVYYGYLAGGGRNEKAILDASICVELIHNYLLAHDDIIDRDELRRGKPTIHKHYQNFYRKLENGEHFGNSAGILIGDLLCNFGYESLTNAKFSETLKNRALARLNQMLAEVIFGEMLDVFLGIRKLLKEKDILKILKYKTAKYTIEGPLHIGAILAGSNKKTLRILSQYNIPLGVAFQIQDDILGIFGEVKATGKAVGADVREGKQTLLIFRAMQQASERQRKIIKQTLGNNKASAEDIQKIKEIVINTGSLEYCQKMAELLVRRSKKVIEKSSFALGVKEFLIGIADYIIKRTK